MSTNLLSTIHDQLDAAAIRELATNLLKGNHTEAETTTHLVALVDGLVDLRAILPPPWGALGESIDRPLLRLVIRPIVKAVAASMVQRTSGG